MHDRVELLVVVESVNGVGFVLSEFVNDGDDGVGFLGHELFAIKVEQVRRLFGDGVVELSVLELEMLPGDSVSGLEELTFGIQGNGIVWFLCAVMQVVDIDVSEVALVTRGFIDFVREDLFEGFHGTHVTSGVEVLVRGLGERIEFGDVFPREAVGFCTKEDVSMEFFESGFHLIWVVWRKEDGIISVRETENVSVVESGEEFSYGVELV